MTNMSVSSRQLAADRNALRRLHAFNTNKWSKLHLIEKLISEKSEVNLQCSRKKCFQAYTLYALPNNTQKFQFH